MHKNQKGFGIVEIVVIIALIGLCVALCLVFIHRHKVAQTNNQNQHQVINNGVTDNKPAPLQAAKLTESYSIGLANNKTLQFKFFPSIGFDKNGCPANYDNSSSCNTSTSIASCPNYDFIEGKVDFSYDKTKQNVPYGIGIAHYDPTCSGLKDSNMDLLTSASDITTQYHGTILGSFTTSFGKATAFKYLSGKSCHAATNTTACSQSEVYGTYIGMNEHEALLVTNVIDQQSFEALSMKIASH